MEYRIKDWRDRDCLTVSGDDFGDDQFVILVCRDSHMAFQGNFTPAQARELANALNDCADTLEVIAERKREVAQEVEQ